MFNNSILSYKMYWNTAILSFCWCRTYSELKFNFKFDTFPNPDNRLMYFGQYFNCINISVTIVSYNFSHEILFWLITIWIMSVWYIPIQWFWVKISITRKINYSHLIMYYYFNLADVPIVNRSLFFFIQIRNSMIYW